MPAATSLPSAGPLRSPRPTPRRPHVPTNLQGTGASASQINLTWTASTDNVAVTGYRVYRNGSLVASPAGTSYSDTGLSEATSYSYRVAAYDAAGNTSSQCTAVAVSTLDATVPSVPTNLQGAGASASQINLTWTASTDNVAVTGYRVYRDGSEIGTTAVDELFRHGPCRGHELQLPRGGLRCGGQCVCAVRGRGGLDAGCHGPVGSREPAGHGGFHVPDRSDLDGLDGQCGGCGLPGLPRRQPRGVAFGDELLRYGTCGRNHLQLSGGCIPTRPETHRPSAAP